MGIFRVALIKFNFLPIARWGTPCPSDATGTAPPSSRAPSSSSWRCSSNSPHPRRQSAWTGPPSCPHWQRWPARTCVGRGTCQRPLAGGDDWMEGINYVLREKDHNVSRRDWLAYLQRGDLGVVQLGHVMVRQRISSGVVDLEAKVELEHVQ